MNGYNRHSIVAAILLCAGFIGGCNEVELAPVSSGATLCQEYYEACVNPILTQPIVASASGNTITCAGEGCHNVENGAGGTFKLFARATGSSVEMTANFLSAKAFTNIGDPAMSKILLEPLAGAPSIVGSHSGGDIFADANDVNHRELYFWITNPQSSATESCPQLDHYPSDTTRRCLTD